MFDKQKILLNAWREVCLNTSLQESLSAVHKLLGRKLPAELMVILLFDGGKLVIEGCSGKGYIPGTGIDLDNESLDDLREWCGSSSTVILLESSAGKRLLKIFFADGRGSGIGCGFKCRDYVEGILVFLSSAASIGGVHIELSSALAHPVAAAFENHLKIRELAHQKEAAEADRRALLSKLSRKDVSDTVVGVDSGLRVVMERVGLVSRSDVPVLILGETGTGKELVSRGVHRLSNRSDGPFIRVNCGAIPSELVDAQLFGHERGAFTGAVESRKGWFERADGGTLFLDEIGELPMAAQVRLLRILQDGWLERVGGTTPIRVDVRIVAATHRDLAEMVGSGSFREDLWYRIAVFPIRIPPLRERVGDIPELAAHFAERASVRFGLPCMLPDEIDNDLLKSYSWPGNVRELAAVIDRAAILGNGCKLEIRRSLGSDFVDDRPVSGCVMKESVEPGDTGSRTLDSVMKAHIEQTLRQTGGRIDGSRGCAEILGIHPQTLRARMTKLGVDWKLYRHTHLS